MHRGARCSVLVVTESPARNLWLSVRNVPQGEVRAGGALNAHAVLHRMHVFLTSGGWGVREQKQLMGQ